ncbi:MAG TPA: molecular chaperone HtpG [Saprospiraceae bacterium]|nr:molecular chaperone HtpG [Saprospiraceae bacterium]
MKKGAISVETQNIFPIIKKFLYSDQEIFLRELVSNAVDATTKLKTLANKGIYKGEIGDLHIKIELDKEKKLLKIIDRGIGMTSEEVEKYLNQVAFSSAAEFVEKYKGEEGIIGHFGLGFYSAFMVAEKVEVLTKSYQENSKGVKWSCDGEPEYELEEIDKKDRGTEIHLHIADDAEEYLEEAKIQQLLETYCKFLPVEIIFGKETVTEGEGDEKIEKEVDRVINNPNPAWKKSPSDLTDEDYKSFYREMYPFAQEPLFWIHLNIDYPFKLTGILYFPKLNNQFEQNRNKVQLYCNQVFVTDEIKQILPEFLTLMNGVIDSPDIPLNVSRSYLQSDSNVKKIGSYISKKVAERLKELYKEDKEKFGETWPDVGPIVKYGMITDEKFYKRAKDFALIKNLQGESYTIDEYRAHIKENQTDKNDTTVIIYANDPDGQHGYIEQVKDYNYDVAVLDHVIDNHFIQAIEQQEQNLRFVRVDSEIPSKLVEKEDNQESALNEKEQEQVKTVFTSILGEAQGKKVELKALSPKENPVMIVHPEFMRRFQEMQAMQGGMPGGMDMDMSQVVINSNHELIAEKLLKEKDEKKRLSLAKHLYSLALLNKGMLKGKDLTEFVKESMNYLKK